MYKDIENIIHKYHHNLKMSDVLRELKMKHITFNHKCHYCNEKKLTINRKPCLHCNIYVCNECEDFFDFNIDRMMCCSCVGGEFDNICCLTFIEFIINTIFLSYIIFNVVFCLNFC